MNQRKKLQVAIALVFAATAIPTWAGFEVVEEPAPAPVAAPAPVKTQAARPAAVAAKTSATARERVVVNRGGSVLAGGVNHVGRKPAILPPAKGFGKGVSLRDALGMLVPGTIEVYNDGQVNLNTPVNWNGNDAEDWAGVLGNMLRSAGISATLDWNARSLTLEQQRAPLFAKSVPTWKLAASDKTIRASLLKWATKAGWHLDWDIAVDYPIPYDVDYTGDFEAAVEDVLSSLRGSDYPAEACAYDNRTIRVVRLGEANRCKLQIN